MANLPKLHEAYLAADRAWRQACADAGIDLYSDAAEGQMIGRGKIKTPDAMRKLFEAREAARLAWLGGE